MTDYFYDLNDVYNAGALLSWAFQPKERPVNNEHYHILLEKYLHEPAFSLLVEHLAHGFRLSVLEADQYGMILEPTENSPFALTPTEYRPSASTDERILDGLINIAIATTAYPRPQDLEANVNVMQGVLRIEEVDKTLRGFCVKLENSTRRHPDPTIEEVRARLQETWRLYKERAPIKQTTAGRRGVSSTSTMIQHAFDFLKKQDCFQSVPNGYRPTRRYQVHVQRWSATRFYQAIRAILEEE